MRVKSVVWRGGHSRYGQGQQVRAAAIPLCCSGHGIAQLLEDAFLTNHDVDPCSSTRNLDQKVSGSAPILDHDTPLIGGEAWISSCGHDGDLFRLRENHTRVALRLCA